MSRALKAVADAGYKQVEPYGFPDAQPMIKAAGTMAFQVNRPISTGTRCQSQRQGHAFQTGIGCREQSRTETSCCPLLGRP